MPFATWWRGDPCPELEPLPGFRARRVTSTAAATRITGLPETRVLARHQQGHRLYAAYLAGEAAGYGWAATWVGGIEELDLTFAVPRGSCYLWDFLTLPAWRGRGVYPRLLQAILRLEAGVERFWIGYEAHNVASERGIARAGFQVIGDLEVEHGRATGFVASPAAGQRAEVAAALLGLPLLGARRPAHEIEPGR